MPLRLLVMLRLKAGQSIEAATATLRDLQPQLTSSLAPKPEPFTLAPPPPALLSPCVGRLFGLTPLDPATLIGVAALFAIGATLAALLPAHRATKVEPLVALRNE
jgi:hypothetical protein